MHEEKEEDEQRRRRAGETPSFSWSTLLALWRTCRIVQKQFE